MSYALIVAETRRGVFEERNLDTIGLAALLGKESVLVVPENVGGFSEKLVTTVVRVKAEESVVQNPLNMTGILEKVTGSRGKPDFILFTSSSAGIELAAYCAGRLDAPLLTDVSGCNKETGVFYKSYYADKIFGEFRQKGEGPFVMTIRSGSFREHAAEKASAAAAEALDGIAVSPDRTFVEYVEEESTEIDITKAEFLLSVGRGIGNKDEITDYEELAGLLRAVLSGSRPVIDKMWLPKPRQVGTSGKTVKPKVYFAMGISGAFQHIAGMKDSDCIIAVNKDPEAPIFQYAHFGVVADANKLRDRMRDIVKG